MPDEQPVIRILGCTTTPFFLETGVTRLGSHPSVNREVGFRALRERFLEGPQRTLPDDGRLLDQKARRDVTFDPVALKADL